MIGCCDGDSFIPSWRRISLKVAVLLPQKMYRWNCAHLRALLLIAGTGWPMNGISAVLPSEEELTRRSWVSGGVAQLERPTSRGRRDCVSREAVQPNWTGRAGSSRIGSGDLDLDLRWVGTWPPDFPLNNPFIRRPFIHSPRGCSTLLLQQWRLLPLRLLSTASAWWTLLHILQQYCNSLMSRSPETWLVSTLTIDLYFFSSNFMPQTMQ